MNITKGHLKIGGVVIASTLLAMNLPAASNGNDVRLVDAVKNSDKAAIQALLPQHIDPNVPDLNGSTALHWASRWNNLEAASALIKSGANVKAANRYGVTPLSLACINGSAPMIELLLKAGADANTVLPEGETALMTAARTGDVNAVKALIAHGADVNFKETQRGQTALMWAAAEGNAEVVAELVERGADMHART
jgi:ankyrin repeat protein